MGLDMFLHGIVGKKKNKPLKVEGLATNFSSARFEVLYWRKANAIHNWFVRNVQDDDDDCRSYLVELEQLEELLKIINKILDVPKKEKIVNSLQDKPLFNIELAKELLPCVEGCFFGSSEYDKWYAEELQKTKEAIEKEIKRDKILEKKGFYIEYEYSSSW